MALCQAPLQTTGISPVKRYDPLQGSSGVQTPNLQALHVVRRIFIFIYGVAGTVLAENTQKPLLLQTSPKKKDKDEGKAQRLSNDVEEVSRKYTAWNKVSPSSKLLQESKSSTSSAFLTIAFPHLLGEFIF